MIGKRYMRALGFGAVLALSAGLAAAAESKAATETVTLEGTRITLDDALFTGCFHNAFEGLVEKKPDGSVKPGEQGIQRTKGVLFGAGSDYSAMTVRFALESVPAGEAWLVLNGLDDADAGICDLSVRLNDVEIHRGPLFTNNDLSVTRNARYFTGWRDERLRLPAGSLKKGNNTLTVSNATPLFESDRWVYTAIDVARLEFTAPVKLAVVRPPWPIYYYGLTEGIELNLWPSVNLGKICLFQGTDLEFNFYATLPTSVVAALSKKTEGSIPLRLNILTGGDVQASLITGEPFERGKTSEGQTLLHRDLDFRVVHATTPHPAQGVRVLLRAGKAFENATLKAWFEAPGLASQPRQFPLRAVAVPAEPPAATGFELSLWGGGMSDEPEARDTSVDLLRRVGVTRLFTGNTPDLNRALRKQGIAPYPRFGWFGGKFTVNDRTRAWASVGADGSPSKKDFCPLAILEHAADPEVGRYFAEAETLARQPDIGGLCVDFETAAVWCWCDRCLALFARETGLAVKREDLVPGGAQEDAYREFGRRRNRDLLSRVRDGMKKANPALRYVALASAADMPAYWWDGRSQGRHSMRELATFADEIAASGYFYEVPGGFKSVRAIIDMGKQFARGSGRDVDVSMISPIATTVSETPRYRGATMSPDSLRQLILLVASAKGRGLSIFRGDCFDGEHYLACRRALEELALLRPYFENNPDRSRELIAEPAGPVERRTSLAVSDNLMARLPWRADIAYAYDAVQYARDYTGRDRVLLLFNYSDRPLPLRVKVLGLFDAQYRLSELRGGKELKTVPRRDLEGGRVDLTVPAHDCLMVRMEALREAKP